MSPDPMTHRPTPPAPRIQWHEGMLLSPQHFQQESARVDDLIAWQHLAAHPLGWGLRRLDIDESLLTNGLVRVLALEAVMPDGMAVTWPASAPGLPDLALDITPLAAQLEEAPAAIYLTVGQARSLRVSAQPARFRGVPGERVEDEISEALPVDMPRAVPNLALAVGERPSSAYLSLKLMTVRKDNEVYKRGAYEPAWLEVPLHSDVRQRAQALAAQMRSKAAFLVKQTSDPSSRIEDRLAILEGKARLASLVFALPVLEALLRSPSVPPHALYLALCAQLGPLATLRPGAVPMLPPAWVHDDPMAGVGPVLDARSARSGAPACSTSTPVRSACPWRRSLRARAWSWACAASPSASWWPGCLGPSSARARSGPRCPSGACWAPRAAGSTTRRSWVCAPARATPCLPSMWQRPSSPRVRTSSSATPTKPAPCNAPTRW
jgi:type VI secretion system protein ImpJ